MNNVEKYTLGVLGTSAVAAGVLAARGKKRRAADTQKPYYKNYHKPSGFYEAHVKRPLDCYLSSMALVLLSPLLCVVSVLFEQGRPGKDGKIFKLYKFRTMTDEKGADGQLLSDADRLTPFGEKLRSTSIDELPELINIAEGDMAIVGPRPLLPEYLPRYSNEELHRHDVLPGLTGLAQANGRNALSWSEKFRLDNEYVGHITFMGDVKILFETVKSVLGHEGISSGTSATMEEFTGDKA